MEWSDLLPLYIASYSFFDSYDVELLGRTRKRQDPHTVGEPILEWNLTNQLDHSRCRKSYPVGGVLRKICKNGTRMILYTVITRMYLSEL